MIKPLQQYFVMVLFYCLVCLGDFKNPITKLVPWVPEAFHGRFSVSVKSWKVTHFAARVFGPRSSPMHARKNLWYPMYQVAWQFLKSFWQVNVLAECGSFYHNLILNTFFFSTALDFFLLKNCTTPVDGSTCQPRMTCYRHSWKKLTETKEMKLTMNSSWNYWIGEIPQVRWNSSFCIE